MCLVNNERGVLAQQLIVLNFGEQNPSVMSLMALFSPTSEVKRTW